MGKITPNEQRELAARAMTTPQNLDRRGIKAKHTAKTNRDGALEYAAYMIDAAVQSTNRAQVLFEFAEVDVVLEPHIFGMANMIGVELHEFEAHVQTGYVADVAIQMKQWQIYCDKKGDYELASKIAGAWAFFVVGEWDNE